MSDWPLSVLWYGGLLAILLGLTGIVLRLVRWHFVFPRGPVVLIVAGAIAIALLIWRVPAARSGTSLSTALDRAIPSYQFREIHSRSILAPVERVRQAVNDVTAGEIALFHIFTTIRRFGRSAPESILNAPDTVPVLEVATKSGFILLADTDREVAIGSVVAAPRGFRAGVDHRDAAWFEALAVPGVVKAALNFVVEPDGIARTRITTETRVFASDHGAARAFTAYWRTIFPGSWILRVTWLDAIARRAEKSVE